MTDIFISYKREDRSFAKTIAEHLIASGYSVWWDIELLPGDKFADEINIVLKDAKLIIVLWTPESIQSNWVKSEATIGLKNETLLPVNLRETEIPVPFNTLHSLDLKSWFLDQDKASLTILIDAVERKIGPSQKIKEKITEEELNDALDRPKHEMEFWTSISTSPKQTANEYQLYIDKYGENGSFSELAFSRIKTIQSDSAKGPGLKNSLTILSVVMGIAVGGFTIAQILGVFEKDPAEAVPTVFDKEEQQDNSISAVYEIPDSLITYGKPLLIKARTIKSNNSVIRSYPENNSTPASPKGAAGVNGSNGNNGSGGAGGNGTSGKSGADGQPGKGAGEIQIVADRLIGSLRIMNIGTDGGAGGAGGDGGKGGNGGSGANGVSGVLDCRSGPGNGGPGGNSGNGGDGGPGGKGGNGGSVIIVLGRVEPDGGLDIKTKGGNGGKSGAAGKTGAAGQGGPRGSAPGLCTAGGRGPGANGVLGQPGKSFESGPNGSSGKIEVTVDGSTMSATGSFSRTY